MTLERDIPIVLASFRTTSRDLYRTGKVNEYAFEAEQGVLLLQDMADDYGAASGGIEVKVLGGDVPRRGCRVSRVG